MAWSSGVAWVSVVVGRAGYGQAGESAAGPGSEKLASSSRGSVRGRQGAGGKSLVGGGCGFAARQTS